MKQGQQCGRAKPVNGIQTEVSNHLIVMVKMTALY